MGAVLAGLIVLAGLAFLLLCPASVQLRLKMQWGAGSVRLKVRAWGIPFTFRLRFCLNQDGFRFFQLKRQGEVKQIRPFGRKKQDSPLKGLWKKEKVCKLVLNAAFGVKDDAALTALLCGAAQTFLAQVIRCLPLRTKSVSITAEPVWDEDLLRINLEGIVKILPAHIISTALENKRKKRKE